MNIPVNLVQWNLYLMNLYITKSLVCSTTNHILQPGQSYSKMYETEPRYNEFRYNEIIVITNAIQKPKRKFYPDITKKCHHATNDECKTDRTAMKII